MKFFFTFLAALFVTAAIHALPVQSRVSISATGNNTIRVVIDGNRYRDNDNMVMADNLSSGYHSIKVYQLKKGRRNYSSANYQLVYNGNIYVRPQYHVDIVINRFGKAFVDEQPIASQYYNDQEEEDNGWENNNGGWNSNNSGYNYQAMNARSFEQFKQSLRKENFDDSRITLAKQVMANNYFTTAQVKDLLQLFSFENNKLEMAKYAFKYTTDKGNYFILNDSFIFKSNKDELMRFVQESR